MKRKRAYLATFEISHEDDTTTEKTVRVWSVMRGWALMELLFPDSPAFLIRIAVEYTPSMPAQTATGGQLNLFDHAH